MRHTTLLGLSINNEILMDLDRILKENPNKFHNRSHLVNKMLEVGLKDFIEGQKLVRFVDNILGNKGAK